MLHQNDSVVGVHDQRQRTLHAAPSPGKIRICELAQWVVTVQPQVKRSAQVVLGDVIFDGLQAFPVKRLAQNLQSGVDGTLFDILRDVLRATTPIEARWASFFARTACQAFSLMAGRVSCNAVCTLALNQTSYSTMSRKASRTS